MRWMQLFLGLVSFLEQLFSMFSRVIHRRADFVQGPHGVVFAGIDISDPVTVQTRAEKGARVFVAPYIPGFHQRDSAVQRHPSLVEKNQQGVALHQRLSHHGFFTQLR